MGEGATRRKRRWVLYLDTDNGETQLDARGTFLQRLGFTKRDVSQWMGPLLTTGVPEYYVKATNRPFLNEKTLTMLGVEFSWNPATKKVTLETGWRDRKLTSLEVTLSIDLAELFHLTETAGLRVHPKDKTYTLINSGKLDPKGSGLYHVPLADEYEGWAQCCYGMLNVQSSKEVVYDFHHDATSGAGVRDLQPPRPRHARGPHDAPHGLDPPPDHLLRVAGLGAPRRLRLRAPTR